MINHLLADLHHYESVTSSSVRFLAARERAL